MPGTSNSGGRNAKSKRMHIVEGTFRADRHADDAVEAPKGQPELPKPLDGDALDEWNRMIARMTLVGSLSSVDDAALYQYCRLFGETEEARTDLEVSRASAAILEENIHGLTGPDLVAVFQEIGKLRHDIKGYLTTLRQGRMAIRQYLVEFGMTPAARSRVRPNRDDDAPISKLDRFTKARA